MIRGKYGKGMIPSAPHKVGLGHPSKLISAVGTLPSSSILTMPPVVDQLQTSSCTGNGGAVAIQEAMTEALWEHLRAATPNASVAFSQAIAMSLVQWVELPARLFLYYNARAIEGGEKFDEGAQIMDIYEGARLLGVPKESAWTFSEDVNKITAQPDTMAFHRAADQRIKNGIAGVYRILTQGSQRGFDLMSILAGGDPVEWGTDLDMAFEDLKPGQVWPGVTGEIIGGHAMIICGYRTTSSGQIEFLTRNSWGPDWNESGSAWVSWNAVTSSHASDFQVVKAAPYYSEIAA